jgi:single-strand DNA-binding protein
VRSVNKVTLLGRVGKDPELKATAGGTNVANLSLATDDRRKDAQGNWQNQTEWHNLVAFGKTADVFQQYVRKGAKLYIEGKIQTRSWEKDGQKHYKTEIVVNEMSMLDEKPQSEPAKTSAPTWNEINQPAAEVEDDDVPF